jgi:hypothetical protein
MTPPEREVARRFLAATLNDDDLKQSCEWDLKIPTSSYYALRAKFFARVRAVAERHDAPIINLLIAELFHRAH